MTEGARELKWIATLVSELDDPECSRYPPKIRALIKAAIHWIYAKTK